MKDPVESREKSTEYDKLFANHKSDKGSVFKLYKEFSKLNNVETNNPIRKWAHGMTTYFTKEDTQK